MDIFCIEDFKSEFERLKSKKSYKTIENDIIDHFFGKSINDLNNGDLLNASKIAPFLKKRLRGRGGFRVYFLIIIKNDRLYLAYIHPKTGSKGAVNITDEMKAYLQKQINHCIETNDLYKLSLNEAKTEILFKKTIPTK